VLANAAAAVARNDLGAACSVRGLSWSLFTPALLALPPQDVLLGADVLYDSAGVLVCTPLRIVTSDARATDCATRAEFEPLLATVAFLLRRGSAGASFVTAYQHRSRHASLEWRLAKWVRAQMLPRRRTSITASAFDWRSASQGLVCAAITHAEALLPPGAPLPRESIEVVELVLR
jgi:hypothetical protein